MRLKKTLFAVFLALQLASWAQAKIPAQAPAADPAAQAREEAMKNLPPVVHYDAKEVFEAGVTIDPAEESSCSEPSEIDEATMNEVLRILTAPSSAKEDPSKIRGKGPNADGPPPSTLQLYFN